MTTLCWHIVRAPAAIGQMVDTTKLRSAPDYCNAETPGVLACLSGTEY